MMNDKEIAKEILVAMIQAGYIQPIPTEQRVEAVSDAYKKILAAVNGD